MDEKYDLKWKTFNEHLVEVFKDLGEQGHFADVTLVSDDQIQTPAHKVVLSACSPVLKTLLVNNPHPHPMLYLRGIKQTELQAILNFMYFGETQLSETRMKDFVTAAKDLEIKEMNNDRDETEDDHKNTEDIDLMNANFVFNGGLKVMIEEPEIEKNKKEIKTYHSTARSQKKTEGKYLCIQCDAVFGYPSHLRRHKQSRHEGKFEDVTLDTNEGTNMLKL